MVLISHIIIALTSIIFTGITYAWPSQNKMRVSYGLVGLTLATGTYLVLAMPAHLVSACGAGLTYLAVVAVGMALASRRLAAQLEK